MCGFAGIFSVASSAGHCGTVARMLRLLHHRGPDSEGWIQSQYCVAGFRRLSIIDLLTGDQPVKNEDGTIHAIFNGEIYNYIELREYLEQRGHVIFGRSDAAILPHLFEEHGESMLSMLVGMFSIVIFDDKTQTGYLFRDHFSIKPLYWSNTEAGLLFSSEIKSILLSDLVTRTFDESAVYSHLNFLCSPGRTTVVRGIFRLYPGEVLVWSAGAIRLMYTKSPAEKSIPGSGSEKLLEVILRRAVDRQTFADVPVGISLSGGVDSTLVACMISPERRHQITAVTVDFGADTDAFEVNIARAVAQELGICHKVIQTDPAEIVERLPRAIWYLDEPIGDPAFLSAYVVSEIASQFVKVLLSGAGGDEIFGGYGHFFDTRRGAVLRRIPKLVRDMHLVQKHVGGRRSREWLEAAIAFPCNRLPSSIAARRLPLFDNSDAFSLPYEVVAEEAWNSLEEHDPTSRQFFAEIRTYLDGQVLPMLDRATMAWSIEGRVPLLDHEIVGAAFSIPGHVHTGNGRKHKAVARSILQRHLHNVELDTIKRGFTNPIAAWIARGGWRLVQLTLLDHRSRLDTIAPRAVRANIAASAQSITDNWLFGYNYLVLRIWEMIFFDETFDGIPEVPTSELLESLGSNHDI